MKHLSRVGEPVGMHRPTVAALLFVLVVAGYALAGFAVVGVASGATPAESGSASAPVTVSGTVTDEAGQPVTDAYVLLEPTPTEHVDEALAGHRSIAEVLLRFGIADVDGLTVAETDDEGRFSASVPAGEYAVIAVAEESRAVSPLRTVTVDDDATVDLQVDPHRIVYADLEVPDRVAPGETVTVTVDLANPDDRAVESLTMTLSLPDGWTVESVDTTGDWDADARRLRWETVPAGEQVEATLTLQVPPDADREAYPVELTAEAESHFVEYDGYDSVDVMPPGATRTPPPSPIEEQTVTPGPDEAGGDGSADPESPTPSSTSSATSRATDAPAGAPGFGFVAAVAALALLAARRR